MGQKLDLDEERRREIQTDSTDRLGYVLEALAEAEELGENVDFRTELFDGVTVEEAIGALAEADAGEEARN